MLLKIVGDAVALAQIKAANQEPLIVVDPMLPFSDPNTSAKFASILGCDPASSMHSLGLQMSAGNATDPMSVPVDLSRSPQEQDMRTGTVLYLTRESRPFAYPLSSPTPTGEPAQMHARVTPAAPHNDAWQRSASSPLDSRHVAPIRPTPQFMSQTPTTLFQPEPNVIEQTPRSVPWDVTSQMEEAAAKRRAQQIMGDFMRNKGRVTDLEAELDDARREVLAHRETIGGLERTLRDTQLYRDELKHNNDDADELRKQIYDLKKDNLELRKANTLYERKERDRQGEVEALQMGVESAEQRGRASVEKRLSATQEELLEAKAFIDALKERLIAQAAEMKKLHAPHANEPHTEHIILPPGMLRKLVTVNGGGVQYYREKFNIDITLLDNTMTVTGDPVDIKLLKEECEQTLGLTDPTAVSQAFPDTDITNPKVQELMEREHELLELNGEHRQQLIAAQNTIDSLHLALKHAQGRVESDLESTRELREAQLRETKRKGEELETLKAHTHTLQKELEAKSVALEDANKALSSTIETFQLEFERSKAGKDELTMLRSLVAKKDEELKGAVQDHLLTKKRLDELTLVKLDMESDLTHKKNLVGLVPTLEASFASAKLEAQNTREDLASRCGEWGAERGMLLEKNQRIQEALDTAVAQLEESRRLREDLRLSRLKEEELTARIHAMELNPESQRTADQQREILHLREGADRASRERQALVDSLNDYKLRYDTLLTENEGVKREYITAVDNVTKAELKVANLYGQIEDSRLTAIHNSAAANAGDLAMLQTTAVLNASTVDALKGELNNEARKPYTMTPSMPTSEAAALVDAMRAELESKKRQLSKSQALLLGNTSSPTAAVLKSKSISPHHRRQQDLCDISPAKPVSPPPGFVSPTSPKKSLRRPAHTTPLSKRLSPVKKKW